MNFFKVILRKVVIITTIIVPLNCHWQVNLNKSTIGASTNSLLNPSYNVLRQLDTPAAFYFNNLRINLGYNLYNSCLYVAAGALLSYYDTYLNDNFIDSRFEVNSYLNYQSICEQYNSNDYCESPGIKNDKEKMYLLGDDKEMASIGVSDIEAQIDYYGNHDNYFQFYLLTLAKSTGSLSDYPLSNLNFSNSMDNICKLLNLYLLSIDITHGNAFKCYDNLSYNEIISIVKNGFPVICELEDFKSTTGHAVIAYDYVEGFSNPEDGLIFNMGWEDNYAITFNQLKNSTTYYQIGSVTYLDESMIPFSQSKKYITLSGEYTCMCYLHCNKYSFTVYLIKFEYYDDTYHRYHCSYCGQYYYGEHFFVSIDDLETMVSLSTSSQYELCLGCRYRR